MYELAGFKPEARYRFLEVAAEIDRVICSAVDDIIIELRRRGLNASFLQELYLLTISGGLTVAVAVARAVSRRQQEVSPLGSTTDQIQEG